MIYEYKCNDCGQVSEVYAKMSDPAPEACPKCQKKGTLEKIISSTSFALKGSGWYTTDYKRSSPSTAAKGGGDA